MILQAHPSEDLQCFHQETDSKFAILGTNYQLLNSSPDHNQVFWYQLSIKENGTIKPHIGLIATHVANPSFSHRCVHHSIVTRLPNHWCASSWATTVATCRHSIDTILSFTNLARKNREHSGWGILERAQLSKSTFRLHKLPSAC